MTLIRLLSFIFVLGLTVPSLSFAEFVEEERVDDKWVVDTITENSVHASVNGQVIHGDRFRVRLVKGHCDKGNLLTSVYFHSKKPDIEPLKGRFVPTRFIGGKVIVKVLYVFPFLMGHRAVVDMGWMSIDNLKDIFSSVNPLVIEFVDSEEIKITDYFDIPHNSWSTHGARAALDRAVAICKKL